MKKKEKIRKLEKKFEKKTEKKKLKKKKKNTMNYCGNLRYFVCGEQ
jgi:hypothetical protein